MEGLTKEESELQDHLVTEREERVAALRDHLILDFFETGAGDDTDIDPVVDMLAIVGARIINAINELKE